MESIPTSVYFWIFSDLDIDVDYLFLLIINLCKKKTYLITFNESFFFFFNLKDSNLKSYKESI